VFFGLIEFKNVKNFRFQKSIVSSDNKP